MSRSLLNSHRRSSSGPRRMRPIAGSARSPSHAASPSHGQSPFKNTRLQSAKPAAAALPSLKEARQQSTHNLQLAWESIFERYRADGDHALKGRDDVYDLETGEIVEDQGGADDERCFEIGDFGLPGAMGQDDRSSDDGNNDNEEQEQEDDSSASEPEASSSRDRKPRHRSMKREDSAFKATFDLDGDSSSEEEFAQWSGELGGVSLVYKQERRVAEEMRGDMSAFMNDEARRQAKKISSKDIAATPTNSTRRIKKSESVMPVDFSVPWTHPTVSCDGVSRSAPAHFGRRTPAPSVKPESKPSSSLLRSYSRPPSPTSSSTNRSRGRITTTCAIPTGVGNRLLAQALACDSDSSDDEVSILSPLDLGPEKAFTASSVKREMSESPQGVRRRAVKEELQGVEHEYKLPTPPPSRSGKGSSPHAASSRRSSIERRTPRMEAVVEVFGSSQSARSVTANSARSPVKSSTVPRRSSPLKASSILAYAPISPPTSRSSKTSSVPMSTPDLDPDDSGSDKEQGEDLRDTAEPSDDDEKEEVSRKHIASSKPSPKKRARRSPAFTPELEDFSIRSYRSPSKQSTPSSRMGEMSIKSSPAPIFMLPFPKSDTVLPPSPPRSNVTDASYYFGDQAPQASTSSAGPTLPRSSTAPSTVSGKKVRSPSRIPSLPTCLPHPTHSPSARKESSKGSPNEDVFKIPSPPRPTLVPRSPRKRVIESSSSSSSSDDDESNTSYSQKLPSPSLSPERTIATPTWRPSPGVRSSSVMSLSSGGRRRVGSIARQMSVSVVPPDDDSDESDDPMGI